MRAELHECSPKAHKRRTLERQREEKAAFEARRASEVSAWANRVGTARAELAQQAAVVRSVQASIKKLDTAKGCGWWVLLAISFVFFPVGPIALGVAWIWAYVQTEENKEKHLPGLQQMLQIEWEKQCRLQARLNRILNERPGS